MCNIYLIDNNSTGFFKQYLTNGVLHEEISVLNGKLNGTYKKYSNSGLIEESEYKNNVKNGICKKYNNDKTIIEFTLWNKGLLVNDAGTPHQLYIL